MNTHDKKQLPTASMSLDLDNKWSYLKTHGESGWESFPSYLSVVVPRILEFLDEFDLKITFFIVGQDAALKKNHEYLRMIADRGHEIANHSFHHEPWLHLYTPDELDREFELAEDAIENATGMKTVGFRGPGFSLSDQTLKVMVRRGYQYDCSTFPTFLGPVARAYYFMTASLSREEKEERKVLFGKFSDGLQSNSPYWWRGADGDQLLEIPVSTIPFIKTPFHTTYLQYLATYSKSLAKSYLWTALKTCHLAGVEMSMLLHPLDFLGADDDSDLRFFPAMNILADGKLEMMRTFLAMMKSNFDIVPVCEHAKRAQEKELNNRSMRLAREGAI